MKPFPGAKANEKAVFETRWFNIVTRQPADSAHPHYVINSPDFAVVLALDSDGHLVLVRQYRHGVEQMTLELPAGHVEIDETPEQAARKELLEETGYEADEFELLAELSPSTARFSNRVWCYLAKNARPRPGAEVEPGSERVIYTKGLRGLLQEKEFFNAAQFGVIGIALLSGKVKLA